MCLSVCPRCACGAQTLALARHSSVLVWWQQQSGIRWGFCEHLLSCCAVVCVVCSVIDVLSLGPSV